MYESLCLGAVMGRDAGVRDVGGLDVMVRDEGAVPGRPDGLGVLCIVLIRRVLGANIGLVPMCVRCFLVRPEY